MTNIEKYNNAFVEALELDLDGIENATMEIIDKWDSIGQMTLIAVIEETFGIELKPDEVMAFISYKSGMDILKAHNIEL